MNKYTGRNPYTDYRNSVPFVDLSGFVVKQPKLFENTPVKSLKEYLIRKKFSTMINLRRLEYCLRVEEYRNGRI
ncbi:MAG: hypothetical protein MJ237_05325 [bacterium]|nr:hypothetical protein [bacterium]